MSDDFDQTPQFDITDIPYIEEDSSGLWIAFPDPRRLWAFSGTPSSFLRQAGYVSGILPLCVTDNISPARLCLAYSYGIFPWCAYRKVEQTGVEWWCPLDRFVIFPDKIHISHSLRSLLNKKRYLVTFNESFPEVIERCRFSDRRDKNPNAWLGPEIVRNYTELWKEGVAMSVEVHDSFDSDRLVGGLYGVYINGCFMGESMYSDIPSGSKIALVALAEWMQANGGTLIDCQFETPHLLSMGGEHIGYVEYLEHLNPTAAERLTENPFSPLDISSRLD